MPPSLASGLCRDGACRGTHPAWFAPDESDGQRVTGLRVYNSLTGEKELFVPREGNRVTWYTCGPTVYDVCHMGHARAYLTMDIIRRILEDYLGYEVFLQVCAGPALGLSACRSTVVSQERMMGDPKWPQLSAEPGDCATRAYT
jgi:hypothetical protein